MSLSRFAAACLLAALVLSQPARAQSPTLRGPWLGAGIGTASAAVNCDICTDGRNGGLSGHVGGGFTFSPSLRAGAEIAGWQDHTDNIRQRLMMYGASVYWTPVPGGSWYLKGGMGMMTYNAQDTADQDDDPLGASTAALQLGAGYDFRAGSKLWFTPFANLIVSTSGNLTSGNSIVTDASFSLMQIGAGLTWR
jgi:outer membrane protein with beta-barrel domain